MLAAGARLGPFEIVAPLGSGGMGEVYRARDMRLARDVALKVLPAAFASDADRRTRFEREAKAIASLAHSHICVVHDLGADNGIDYMVMELLEGDTLANRLERGPLPLDQALTFASQIASALDAAHRRGIVHRDLKPANIMLTPSGVKLLDFGLAKLCEPRRSPFMSAAETEGGLTAEGTVVGTVQYMSPEQLEGGEADARSDIFAFGAILFEMVTGEKAFAGGSAISIMSAILKETPKAAREIRPSVSLPLDRLIATCLEKNPDDRWQTARDLTRELRWIATSSGTSSQPATVRTNRRTVAAAVLLASIAMVSGAAATRWFLLSSAESAGGRVALVDEPRRAIVPVRQTRVVGQGPSLALSHDGRRLVYPGMRADASASQLFLHSFDGFEASPIPGTEGAFGAFFAPDDDRFAFFAGRQLWVMSLSGAPPKALCEAPLGVGGTWADDDTIYFAPSVSSGLWKVRSGGGPCQAVTTPDADTEFSHRVPQMLPGGRGLIYTARRGDGEEALKVLTFATGRSEEIVSGGTSGRYVRSGHVVYARAGTLLAVPFDLDSLKTTGPAVALQERVSQGFEAAQFDVSDAGDLVYVNDDPGRARRRLVWVHRDGTIHPVPGQLGAYHNPRISPDDRHATVNLDDSISRSAVYDLLTGARQEVPPPAGYPIWMRKPNDNRIIFSSTLNALVRRDAFRAGEPEVLVQAARAVPGSVTPAGDWLVYHGVDAATGNIDIWKIALTGRAKPESIVSTPDRDVGPQLSPNGELLAYEIDGAESAGDVYVTPLSGGERVKVSVDGGTEPVWSRVGSQLFYRWRNQVMSVTIQTEPSLRAGPPTEVLVLNRSFEYGRAGLAGYDVASDGRFLMIEGTATQELHIAWDWVNGLQRRLASR